MRYFRHAGSRRPFAAFLVLASAMMAAACNPFDNSSSPSTSTSTTDTFSGLLAQGGSTIFTFSVTTAGSVSVTLTSVSPPTISPLGLGVGTANGATCTVTNSTSSATAGSGAQLTVNENPGSYCVKVSDLGNLTATSTISVSVAHS